MAKLYIICGHGNGDPGACANGYDEAERVRAIGKRIDPSVRRAADGCRLYDGWNGFFSAGSHAGSNARSL